MKTFTLLVILLVIETVLTVDPETLTAHIYLDPNCKKFYVDFSLETSCTEWLSKWQRVNFTEDHEVAVLLEFEDPECSIGEGKIVDKYIRETCVTTWNNSMMWTWDKPELL